LNRSIKTAAQNICEVITVQLSQFLGRLDNEVVMQKVFSFPLVVFALKHFKFSKQFIVEQDLLSSLIQFLDEVKRSNSATKLAMKHVILPMVVNSDNRSSYKQKACLPNVHPKNVVKVVKRRKLMNTYGKFLWILSIHNRRSDKLFLPTKAVILALWSSKTCVNPNRKEMVRKRLAFHVYDIKPAQYLLKTQVLCHNPTFGRM
jgi:hypothetical protein